MLARRIPFAVVALHFFGGSIVAVTVEVDRRKPDPGSDECVAFRENGGFCGLCLGTQGFVPVTCIIFHGYSSAGLNLLRIAWRLPHSHRIVDLLLFWAFPDPSTCQRGSS